MGEMEKWGGNGGKWGGTGGELGGKWGNGGKCQKCIVGSVEKMCEIGRNGRKIGEKGNNLGQNSHFSQSHFPPFSTTSTFP